MDCRITPSSASAIASVFVSLLTTGAVAQIPGAYRARWDRPELQQRIDRSIEQHRKGEAVLEIIDANGNSISGATVRIEQAAHAFLFGCNAFVLGQLDTPGENQRYEKQFTKLFNFATVPFYWRGTEPTQGELRYAEGSRRIWRRPPPDRFRSFAEKYDVTLKGHPLVWHNHNPDWLPESAEKLKQLYEKRFREIALRYADHIKIWDVVNESLVCNKDFPLYSEDRAYLAWSFAEVAPLFADGNHLMINEVTGFSFRGTNQNPYFHQIRRLIDDGLRVDGIGFQFHFFSRRALDRFVAGEYRGDAAEDPRALLDVYEHFGRFDRPLWITEITIPSSGTNGRALQARVTRDLYRLWFSVPNMKGITWWNLGDSLAVEGENQALGGLLDENLDPKPAYRVLDQLINHDWKTTLDAKSDADGVIRFRGFYGDYAVRVEAAEGATQTFDVQLAPDGPARRRLTVKKP